MAASSSASSASRYSIQLRAGSMQWKPSASSPWALRIAQARSRTTIERSSDIDGRQAFLPETAALTKAAVRLGGFGHEKLHRNGRCSFVRVKRKTGQNVRAVRLFGRSVRQSLVEVRAWACDRPERPDHLSERLPVHGIRPRSETLAPLSEWRRASRGSRQRSGDRRGRRARPLRIVAPDLCRAIPARNDPEDADLVLAGAEIKHLVVIWMRAVRVQEDLDSVGPDLLDGPLDEAAARPLDMDVFPVRRCVPALSVALADGIMPVRCDLMSEAQQFKGRTARLY